jgi:hypothetical protein
MDRSSDRNRIIEYLQIKPISHSQIYTSQIAVPETQGGEILRDRREALRRSLIEQGSNLIPLIVRRTEAYSNEEEYEVVCGADWCIVAKELGIEQMWAWVFEMTDEEVAVTQAEMEQLAPQSAIKTAQIETLLQQLEISFQQKVESLTKKIEQSIKKNEDFLKKQVKAIADRNLDPDSIAQIKNLVENLEKTFHEKVDKLAKKIEQSGKNAPSASSVISEVNIESALKQLEELDKLLSRKLERTAQAINQYVSDALQDVESDLKNQIEVLRYQLGATENYTKVQPKAQPKTKSKAQSKVPPKTQPKVQLSQLSEIESSQEDYDSFSLRKLKAIGKERKLRGYARMKRPEILAALKKNDGK